MKKERDSLLSLRIEQIHSEIISKISDMLPCNPNLHQAVSNEILQALHKYLD